MLKKKYRLTSSNDFRSVYKNGIKARGDYGMLIFLESQDISSPPKFGFVVGKNIGNAVRRHIHVRRLREITREIIKDRGNELDGLKLSYISFKYCEDFNKLRKEYKSQIEYVIKRRNKDK